MASIEILVRKRISSNKSLKSTNLHRVTQFGLLHKACVSKSDPGRNTPGKHRCRAGSNRFESILVGLRAGRLKLVSVLNRTHRLKKWPGPEHPWEASRSSRFEKSRKHSVWTPTSHLTNDIGFEQNPSAEKVAPVGTPLGGIPVEPVRKGSKAFCLDPDKSPKK